MRPLNELPKLPDKALIDAEKARRSFYEFVRQAWSVIEPGTQFIPSPHIQVICEHLEACTKGEIKRLLINLPPRHGKSSLVSVLWPLWIWASDPTHKFLCAAYRAALAVRDSTKSMRVIDSPWYQKNWGDKFGITIRQAQKIENTEAGFRLITSVVGGATGDGGDTLILDDPHSVTQAASDAEREHAEVWFNETWSTRLNNMKTGVMACIMQRLHERDISGIILEQGGWDHLCLPAEFDGISRSTSLGYYDWRKTKGELLCPDRFGPGELEQLKRVLGEYGTSGQLQQDPSPQGGGILKVDCFKVIDGIPQCFYIVQSLDVAFKAGAENDETAFQAWGVFKMRDGRNGVVLLDAWGDRMTYPELRRKIVGDPDSCKKGEWMQEYGGDVATGRPARRADVMLVEDKAAGQSLIQDLHEANVPVIKYNPGRADKVLRANIVAPIVELGVVHVPASRLEGHEGKPMTWARPFVEQARKFPVAAHDDHVDCFTQVMIYLRDRGMFDLAFVKKDPVNERDYHGERARRVNPYAS